MNKQSHDLRGHVWDPSRDKFREYFCPEINQYVAFPHWNVEHRLSLLEPVADHTAERLFAPPGPVVSALAGWAVPRRIIAVLFIGLLEFWQRILAPIFAMGDHSHTRIRVVAYAIG